VLANPLKSTPSDIESIQAGLVVVLSDHLRQLISLINAEPLPFHLGVEVL
jgi:hypothetical protein